MVAEPLPAAVRWYTPGHGERAVTPSKQLIEQLVARIGIHCWRQPYLILVSVVVYEIEVDSPEGERIKRTFPLMV